jgi:hypothetical protein
VAAKAVEQGVARLTTTYSDEYQWAAAIIRRARNMTQTMMEEGFIAEAE